MALTNEQIATFARNEKILGALMESAEKAAIELCNSGDHALSAKSHKIAAHLRMAYGEGQDMKEGTSLRSGEK